MPSNIFKNSFFAFSSQFFLLASNLGIYAIVGRVLGTDGLGEFSFVLAYVGMFVFLPDLGLNLLLTREIAKQRDAVSEHLGKAIPLISLLAPISYAVFILLSQRFSFEGEVADSIYLAGLYLVLGAFTSLFRGVFYAFERMEYEAVVTVVERVIALIGCVGALVTTQSLLSLIGAYVFARLVALLLGGWLYVTRIGRFPAISFDPAGAVQLTMKAMPFAVNVLATTVYLRLDLVLLSLWKGDTASGLYKAATSLILPSAVIAASLNSAIFPEMTRSHGENPGRSGELVEKSMRMLFAIGWPLAIGIYWTSEQIIFLVFGPGFDHAATALRILAIVVPLRFINSTMGSGLTAVNQQGRRSTIILVGALANLVINIILIPRFSFIGASYATVITEVLLTFFLCFSLSTIVKLPRPVGEWFRVFICGLAMAVVTYLLRGRSLVLIVSMSALCYVVTLFIAGAVPVNKSLSAKQLATRIVMRVKEGT
jgi:O-antigen/teichoic acid export membrane protein